MSEDKPKIVKPEPELEQPADFTSPEKLYDELIKSIRRYHPSDDISLIERAYMTAKNAHMKVFTIFLLWKKSRS